ncbi:AAA+-type ATPase, SpoVK/Ycf46/Vps4 family [Geosmithia morbida]|uniref:AAA+-type ATPase, SpoVK/Ycf46/Vps4 family n=1 Tax=Geosmithia morbida TaxID=1094350 RepID=A0A9P4Z1V7_9HYPO|nr:AAA+-type ATPase, SpoVK/Ycf46/Vps4 family [Geosmithia morbida]KAF4126145.1 AAA+-type ATPase, SpoVK/Ycf46/Vps4 family [Geosmithia morbida]
MTPTSGDGHPPGDSVDGTRSLSGKHLGSIIPDSSSEIDTDKGTDEQPEPPQDQHLQDQPPQSQPPQGQPFQKDNSDKDTEEGEIEGYRDQQSNRYGGNGDEDKQDTKLNTYNSPQIETHVVDSAASGKVRERTLPDQGKSSSSSDDDDDGLNSGSPARKEWMELKKYSQAKNEYIDRLMSMVGLEEVKQFCLKSRSLIQFDLDRGKAPDRKLLDLLNVMFTGNRGTGRTTVADLYASIIREEIALISGSAPEIVKPKLDCICDVLPIERIVGQYGEAPCIIIIDLAEDTPRGWVMCILYECFRNQVINPVAIIATSAPEKGQPPGHAQCMHTLRNEMPSIGLPDYSNEEMADMMQSSLESRLGKIANAKSSRIAIAIRDRFIISQHSGHCNKHPRLIKADILGHLVPCGRPSSDALRELANLNGLNAVKMTINDMFDREMRISHRELLGIEPSPVRLGMVFLGKPGTGKKTVACLYAQLLGEMGLLSSGKTVVKSPSDLIDVGLGSAKDTVASAVAEARGRALIIEDADKLDPTCEKDPSRARQCREVLEKLVHAMRCSVGKDYCFILCGRPDAMKAMYGNSRDIDLESMLPLEKALTFRDFDPEMLAYYLDLKLAEKGVVASEPAKTAALNILRDQSRRDDFCNAHNVDAIVTRAMHAREIWLQQALRASTGAVRQDPNSWRALWPQDFGDGLDPGRSDFSRVRDQFKNFVGFNDILSQLESYHDMVCGMRLRGVDAEPFIPFTLIFKGPPGTGKTSTARMMGEFYRNLGLLPTSKVVEMSATDMVGLYVGNTGPKTRDLLEKSLGKVLIIDEAYMLAESQSGSGASEFTKEAIAELVYCLTKPEFERKLVVILAGNEKEMDKLLDGNPGLRSRFSTHITFPSLSTWQYLEQLRRYLRRVGIVMEPTAEMDGAARKALCEGLTKMMNEKTWGGSRSVQDMGMAIMRCVFGKYAHTGDKGDMKPLTCREVMRMLVESRLMKAESPTWSRRPMGSRLVTLSSLN